jgi:hypothetical protein
MRIVMDIIHLTQQTNAASLGELKDERRRIVSQLLALELAPRNIPLPDEFPITLAWLQEQLLDVVTRIAIAERIAKPPEQPL